MTKTANAKLTHSASAPGARSHRSRATKAAAEGSKEANSSEPAPPCGPVASPRGKIGVVIGLLCRAQGASMTDLMVATGWQSHSVRGAIAGAVKKKFGLVVTSIKTDAGRIYRIETAHDAG